MHSHLIHECASNLHPGRFAAWQRVQLTCATMVLLVAGLVLLGAQERIGTYEPALEGRAMNQPRTLSADKSGLKMSPEDRAAISLSMSQREQRGYALAQDGGTFYRIAHVEFTSEEQRRNFRVPSATVFTAFGPFADMFASSDDLVEAIFRRKDVRWVEWGPAIRVPPLPILTRGIPTRVKPEEIVHGDFPGLTGKGVIIAVIDTGIDFRNSDFVTYEGGRPTSRVLYFWDTFSDAYESTKLSSRPLGSEAPLHFPNGRSVGTLYTDKQLTSDLRVPPGERRIPTPDDEGHGTAAASVAAGNGNNAKGSKMYVGVAPDADIIAVRISNQEKGVQNSYLLNRIVEWLDDVARKNHKAVVISCSWGGHYTGHDGNSIFERHLSARFDSNPSGRAMVIAAGNERLAQVHAKTTIGGKNAPGYLAWFAGMDGASLRIYWHAPHAETFDPSDIDYDREILQCRENPKGCETKFIKEYKPYWYPISGEWVLSINVAPGPGAMRLYTHSGTSLQADAYFVRAPETAVFASNYNAGGKSFKVAYRGEQIDAPGTTANAITVGSYDWNDTFDGEPKNCSENPKIPVTVGDLSCYSNPGYSRSGAVKPEVAAPGEVYYASYARLTDGRGLNSVLPKRPDGKPSLEVDSSGNFILFDGTSAATPYAAGVVALMMQKKPGITVGDIKRLLQQDRSWNYELTGRVPNPLWGYGKLDLAAVRRILGQVR
jgi:subtilisin family serine protease